MSIFRRKQKQDKPAPQRAYEKARKEYRSSLNTLVSSVLVSVLVLAMVTPMIGHAINNESQVFNGPVYQRYGMGTLPLMAYGVDINDNGVANTVARDFAELRAAEAKKNPLSRIASAFKREESSVITEKRSGTDAALWEIRPTQQPSVKVYLLPDFIVTNDRGGILQEGEPPVYVPISRLGLDTGESLDSVKGIPTGENLLDGSPLKAMRYSVVFAQDRASALQKAASGTTAKGKDAKLDITEAEYYSPVYHNNEAYVYFSPKSVIEQYAAVKAEYSQFRTELERRASNGDAKAVVESGMYLATLAILESYLNETLMQDGTRAWSNFNTEAWSANGSFAGVAKLIGENKMTAYARVNNSLSATDGKTSPTFLDFDGLRARENVFHKAGTNDGIYVAPYSPIQFHAMPTSEDTYRFQVLASVPVSDLGEVTSYTSLFGALFDKVFTKSNPKSVIENLQAGSASSSDALFTTMMLHDVKDGYSKSFNAFYNPLKGPSGNGDLFMCRVNPARTPVVPSLPFIGYRPAGGVGGTAVSEEGNPLNPAKATGSMYFAPPSFAPSISGIMADNETFNVLNVELYGLFSNEFYGAMLGDKLVSSNIFTWAASKAGLDTEGLKLWSAEAGGLVGKSYDVAFGANLMAEVGSMLNYAVKKGKTPNKIGWAWTTEYSQQDGALTPAENTVNEEPAAGGGLVDTVTGWFGGGSEPADSGDSGDPQEQKSGIEGSRAYTGKRAVYVGNTTVQRQADLADSAQPYSGLAASLKTNVAKQMYQQGYHVDLALAEMGSALNSINPDFIMGQIVAKAAEWLLRAGTGIFRFAFGASASISGGGISETGGLFSQWNNPFELLVSTPGLGNVYGALQGFGLLFVALFTFYLGFSLVLSTSAGDGDSAWPIDLGISQGALKGAIPRIVVAVLMIGLPPAVAGDKVVPGLSYWIASFIVMLNDTLCNVFATSTTSDFIVNLANISGMAGQSIISALVFALIAMVMFFAFCAGAIMLLFRTLFLYLFVLLGPIVWAFWVLEKPTSNAGKVGGFSMNGNGPKEWLKGITQLAFVQLFWVFAFFIISSLFTSPELTANIFGLRSTVGATPGMATASAAIAVPVFTGLMNSMDLIIRAILVLVAFGIMLKVAAPAFKGAQVSGTGAMNSAVDSLKERAAAPIKNRYDKAKAHAEDAAAKGLNGDFKGLAASVRAAGVDGVKDLRTQGKKVGDAANAVGRAGKLASDMTDAEKRKARIAEGRALLADKTKRALSGFQDDVLGTGKQRSTASAANDADKARFESARSKADRAAQLAAKGKGEDWNLLTDEQRDQRRFDAAEQLMKKDGYGDYMSEAERAKAGLAADGTFTGSQEDRRRVAASQLLDDYAKELDAPYAAKREAAQTSAEAIRSTGEKFTAAREAEAELNQQMAQLGLAGEVQSVATDRAMRALGHSGLVGTPTAAEVIESASRTNKAFADSLLDMTGVTVRDENGRLLKTDATALAKLQSMSAADLNNFILDHGGSPAAKEIIDYHAKEAMAGRAATVSELSREQQQSIADAVGMKVSAIQGMGRDELVKSFVENMDVSALGISADQLSTLGLDGRSIAEGSVADLQAALAGVSGLDMDTLMKASAKASANSAEIKASFDARLPELLAAMNTGPVLGEVSKQLVFLAAGETAVRTAVANEATIISALAATNTMTEQDATDVFSSISKAAATGDSKILKDAVSSAKAAFPGASVERHLDKVEKSLERAMVKGREAADEIGYTSISTHQQLSALLTSVGESGDVAALSRMTDVLSAVTGKSGVFGPCLVRGANEGPAMAVKE